MTEREQTFNLINNEPLISIIIAVYNGDKYLSRCLKGILSQTYNNIEVVLIDDGSFDKSGVICDEYAKQDERIKVYHRKQSGLASSRNFGLDVCRGDYYMFADADDLVSDCYVERLYETIVRSHCKVAVCKSKDIFDYNIENYSCELGDDFQIVSLRDLDYTIPFRYDYWTTWAVWGAIYDKSFFGDLRFVTDLAMSADLIYFAEIIRRCKKMAQIDDRLYAYVRYPSSISSGCYNWNRYSNVLAWERTSKMFADEPFVQKTAEAMEVLVSCNWVKNMVRNGVKDNKLYMTTVKHFKGKWRTIKDVPLEGKKRKKFYFLTHMPSAYLLIYKIAFMFNMLPYQ